MKYLILITLLLSLASKVNSTKTAPSIKQSGGLQLNTFTEAEVPKEIDGCNAALYRSMSERKSDKYIGVNDLGLLAYIKIGNKFERFVQIKYNSVGNKPVWLYQNKDKSIQMKIEVKTKKKTGDESSFITGVMTIETKDGKKIVIPFVGDSGC